MIAARGQVGSRPVEPSFPPVAVGAVAAACGAELSGDPTVVVTDAAYDSRDVRPGSLFFCVRGEHADGHAFAAEAVTGGASAVVVERDLDVPAPRLRVGSVREAMGPMSAVVFGDPAASLTVVGVTGTNGKTTTTYLLEAVFGRSGRVPGVIGTTGARIDGSAVPLERTTPEAPDLHRLLSRMRTEGVAAVAMEVSSHALAQHRVDGVVADVALFTNLSRDHLDYHRSMDAYSEAKARLFTPALARRGVVNADDPFGSRLMRDAAIPLTSFGVDASGADLRATDLEVDARGIGFTVRGVGVRSPLRGRFNVWNCLGALAVAEVLGIDLDVAAAALHDVSGVPGRMEPVDAGQDFLVMVDYAHTPDSIVSVLRGARPLAAGRLIVVFGCGGDRDRAKRPLMGEAATSEADLTIVTSDNPRTEDPLAIIGEIVPGAETGGGPYVVEPDRRVAIRRAIEGAGTGDVVVIAGKGHETVQEIDDDTVPFDDRKVAWEALVTRGNMP
jgi:UDP-N-acetylmuramoyl-L-alanyl-D-glutamate--2,6-diaminopimelate ligase